MTTHNTNKRITYNLIRWGAASHPALQLALGVFDSMLCGLCCDDRWTCGQMKESEGNKESFKKDVQVQAYKKTRQ